MSKVAPIGIHKYIRYNPTKGTFVRYRVWGRQPPLNIHKRFQGARIGSADSQGYLKLSFRGKNYRASQVAWYLVTGRWAYQVRFIDGDHTNCKWSNLREVGTPGVHKLKRSGRYKVRAVRDGKQINVGTFRYKKDAMAALALASTVSL